MFTFHDFLNMRNNINRVEFKRFTGKTIKKPEWLIKYPNDRLNLVYDNFEELYCNGEIYLSCILRANVSLFRQIEGDRPAFMLYTNDEFFYKKPNELLKIAKNLPYIEQNNFYDDRFTELKKILNDDYYRPLNVKIPSDITNNHEIWITSIMVFKEHIPFHRLSNFFYPLLVLNNKNIGGMIVLKWYWSENFRRYVNFNYHNEVKSHIYDDIPSNVNDFFKPFASKVFFKEHPLHYIAFTILEVLSLILPLEIYIELMANKTITDFNLKIGVIGTLLISGGFINVIWSFMDKYLGNKMTIYLFTIGIILVLVSIKLMLS